MSVTHSMYVDMHRPWTVVRATVLVLVSRPGPVFDKPWPGRCTQLLCSAAYTMHAVATSKELTSQVSSHG